VVFVRFDLPAIFPCAECVRPRIYPAVMRLVIQSSLTVMRELKAGLIAQMGAVILRKAAPEVCSQAGRQSSRSSGLFDTSFPRTLY
jgi:hypothetical protein